MPGRSLPDFQRVYINGYDMSGYTNDTSEKGVEFGEAPSMCFSDTVMGYLRTKPQVMAGPILGVFDNTATVGLHAIASTLPGSRANLMIARGVRTAPVYGDDVFAAPMLLGSYKARGEEAVAVSMTMAGLDQTAGLNYVQYFGKLLHVYQSYTAANSANTNIDNGAATTGGGWLMYHIRSITGAGTVTASIDDSANGSAWAALSGATTGAIATASAPTSGIVQLATTATVRQYLRWQFALGGSATAATLVLGFMRG